MRSGGYRLIIFKAIIFYNQIFFKIPNDKRKSARLLPPVISDQTFKNFDKESYRIQEPLITTSRAIEALPLVMVCEFWGGACETYMGHRETTKNPLTSLTVL